MKISYDDVEYILRGNNQSHCIKKYLANWTIDVHNVNAGILTGKLKWWCYLLLFIPMNVATFIYCLWDGGLRDFQIFDKTIFRNTYIGYYKDEEKSVFGRMYIVYNKKKGE